LHITHQDSQRLTAAVFLIIFSSIIMLFFGWECHSEFAPGWPLGEFEEHCGPVYELVLPGLLLVLVGIALIAYTMVGVSRGPLRRARRERP